MPDALRKEPPAGGVCSAHVGSPAVVVCARCGDFACAECVAADRPGICKSCRAQPGLHQLGRNWTVRGLVRHSWRVFSASAVTTTVALCAAMVPILLLEWAPDLISSGLFSAEKGTPRGQLLRAAMSLLANALEAPFVLGMYAYAAARVREDAVEFAALWRPAHRWPGYLPLAVVFWVVGLPAELLQPEGKEALHFAVLAVVTMTLEVLYLAAVELAVAEEGEGRPLRRAFAAIRGRLPGVLLVCALCGVATLGSVALCVLPALVVIPFTTLVYVTMYLAMRADPAPSRPGSP